MKNPLQTYHRCPFCLSDNIVPVSLQTLACTGAGGIIGGIVTAVATKDNPDGVSAGPVIAGALTGAMTGLTVGREIQKDTPDKPYLCLGCFRSFSHAEKLQSQRWRKGGKTQTNTDNNFIKQEVQ